MSFNINLHCSEGVGGAWVDVRGLVYLLGTGGYNKLLRLLGKAGYEIHRSRSSTWVKGKKPCNELVREINELVEKITSEEERGGAGGGECRPADIGSIINAIVGRVSSLIPSLKDTVDEVDIDLVIYVNQTAEPRWSLTMHENTCVSATYVAPMNPPGI